MKYKVLTPKDIIGFSFLWYIELYFPKVSTEDKINNNDFGSLNFLKYKGEYRIYAG